LVEREIACGHSLFMNGPSPPIRRDLATTHGLLLCQRSIASDSVRFLGVRWLPWRINTIVRLLVNTQSSKPHSLHRCVQALSQCLAIGGIGEWRGFRGGPFSKPCGRQRSRLEPFGRLAKWSHLGFKTEHDDETFPSPFQARR
jgi:hypothetical protein